MWAEDSEAPAQPPVRRGRRPAKQAHPFAVPADALAVMTVREGTPGTAVLALPNQGRGPSASAEVHRTRAESPTSVGREAPADGLWEVPTLALDPPNALDFLLESGNDEFDPERPAAGGDLRALQALAGLAVDLVGRGRVLPGVRAAGDGRAMAVWSAVVTGADAVWLRAAAGGLPGSFTAAYPASVDRGEVAVRMLAAATDSLVDAAVRSRLGPGRRRRRRTAASFRSALTGSDPYFAITPVALAALDAALADWQREVTQVGAVRACFRLVEPTSTRETFYVAMTRVLTSRCSRPRSRAWSSTPGRCGAPRGLCARWPVTSPTRRRPCSVSSAVRCVSTLTSRVRCAPRSRRR